MALDSFAGSQTALTLLQSELGAKFSLPQSNPNKYLDGALTLLAKSLGLSNTKVEAKLDSVDKRFDSVEERILEHRGLQINGLRRRLDDPIEPIAAPIEHGDGRRKYKVADEFPSTIREFWKLDDGALAQLAQHYGIVGWQNWNRAGSDDTDTTVFNDLDTAVATQPTKCRRILATKWGLDYSQLERLPTAFSKRASRGGTSPHSLSERPRLRTLGKRKLDAVSDSESGSEEKKTRFEIEEVGSDRRSYVLTRGSGNKLFIQEMGPPVECDPSVLSEKIGWKTTSSDVYPVMGEHGIQWVEKSRREPSPERETQESGSDNV